jgi:hypothetical protein
VGAERERVLKIIDDGIAARPELPDYLSIPVKHDRVFAGKVSAGL